jgi:hypothetical protein
VEKNSSFLINIKFLGVEEYVAEASISFKDEGIPTLLLTGSLKDGS